MEDGVHMTGKGFEAGGGDGMTEEVHGGLGKGALGGVDMETIGSQDGEHLAEMPQVVGMTGGGDEDIIQIDENKGKVAEKAVHEALEGLGGIAESKRHGGVFVEAEGRNNGSFGDVGGGNGNLVISFDKVKLGEDSGAPEIVGEILDVREGIPVRSGDGVEAAVVATGAPAATRLGHHVKRGRPRAVRAADDAGGLELGELVLSYAKLFWIQPPRFGEDGWTGGEDMMFHTMRRSGSMDGRRKNGGKLSEESTEMGRRSREGRDER